jgi:hypothetical protein
MQHGESIIQPLRRERARADLDRPQLPPSLARQLNERFGLGAEHVYELGFVQAKDEHIFQAARAAGAILKHFADGEPLVEIGRNN